MVSHDRASAIVLPGFVFDPERRELRDSTNRPVPLRPQTLAVLACLSRQAGHVVTKDELVSAVWPDVVVTQDSLVQCIGELRKALDDAEHRVIQTEHRRGYRLIARPTTDSTATGWTPPDTFQQDLRFATTSDGMRLAYALSGSGPPLVRTPHWMTHLEWDWQSSIWGPRIQFLSRHFTFLRYDGRGCGLSDREAMPGDLDVSVHDFESVVDSAGLEHFGILAPSAGASVAIRYAARHPKRVTHLVLLGACARGALKRESRSIHRENFDAMVRLIEFGWGQDNDAFRQMSTSMLWPGATVEQQRSFNHLQRVSCTPATAAMLLRSLGDYDATLDLPQVRCPTLVLHSPHDARVPCEEGRFIAASIRDAQIEMFDSPNHTPLIGEPAFDQVHRRIVEFVRGDTNGPALETPRFRRPS